MSAQPKVDASEVAQFLRALADEIESRDQTLRPSRAVVVVSREVGQGQFGLLIRQTGCVNSLEVAGMLADAQKVSR